MRGFRPAAAGEARTEPPEVAEEASGPTGTPPDRASPRSAAPSGEALTAGKATSHRQTPDGLAFRAEPSDSALSVLFPSGLRPPHRPVRSEREPAPAVPLTVGVDARRRIAPGADGDATQSRRRTGRSPLIIRGSERPCPVGGAEGEAPPGPGRPR
ncbi:hypothetical protein GCM10010363_71940 [Streptomyces omiyaensis]|nr:hypothetical protein GCM10010363_71940 [Streptomyces omiyaensis]